MKSPIFLLGSGRCGSTLVQRALNAHPEVVMYGEHEGFLGPLSNAYHKLTQTRDIQRFVYGEDAIPASALHGELSVPDADICWVNSFTAEDVYTQFRQLVLSLLASDLDLEEVHWGFKEIRYYKPQHVIWFLQEMFPEARYIFLFRNPADTIASGLSAWEDPEKFLANEEQLRNTVWERFKSWSAKYDLMLVNEEMLGERAYFLRYEDLVADPASHLDHIFGMLGLQTPELSLELFQHRPASTQDHPHKAQLVERLREFQSNTRHEPFRKICARMGYDHLELA